MSNKLKNIGLIGLGMVAGVAGSMQFDALAQRNPQPALPIEELRKLSDVFDLIKSDYVETVEDKKLLDNAVSGMVGALDPHSAYLDKNAYRELSESIEGKFVGLGIEVVGMDEGYVRIISPIEDSPAYHAGLKAGDLITHLDGDPVRGMTLDDAVNDPQMRAAGAFVQFDYPGHGTVDTIDSPMFVAGSDKRKPSPPPEIGANTREVLRDLGYSQAAIDDMIERRIAAG